MDPTAALETIRELVKQIQELEIRSGNYVVLADLALDLAEHVDALDTWMMRSGSFPVQWARKL